MSQSVLQKLAHLPGIDVARAGIRDAQQERRFLRYLREAKPPASGRPTLAQAMAARRPRRRSLSAVPRVVALGHEDWEQHGLWPTFERIARFDLFPIPRERSHGLAGRERLGRDFLDAIDVFERGGAPVEMVFMYCDSGYLSPDMLRTLQQRGIWTVLMGLDDQHKFHRRKEYGLEIGQETVVPLVDLYWTTWKLGADIVEAAGGRAWYAGEGADPAFHHPHPLHRDLDAVFVGGRYGVRRRLVSFLRARGFAVSAFGSGWPGGFLTFEETVTTFSRAKVVLGVGNVGEMRGVFCLKGRDFEVPMCGAVYLTSFNPDLADWFQIGKEILCYSSLANCAEVLGWILARPGTQHDIRSAALARSLREHRWERRLVDLFAVLDSALHPIRERDPTTTSSPRPS